jgi:hypothetical protein
MERHRTFDAMSFRADEVAIKYYRTLFDEQSECA